MKFWLISIVITEALGSLQEKKAAGSTDLLVSEDGLLCYECDAAKDNGEITRGDEACFNPKLPNNLTVGNAGPNGTCISTYWETTTSEGNKMTAIERRLYEDRTDEIQELITIYLLKIRRV